VLAVAAEKMTVEQETGCYLLNCFPVTKLKNDMLNIMKNGLKAAIESQTYKIMNTEANRIRN
jgi:hypothetical protein